MDKIENALDARKLADDPTVKVKRILKLIQEAAKEGAVQFNYGFWDTSGKAMKSVIETLNKLGFGTELYGFDEDGRVLVEKIDVDHDLIGNYELQISW